MTKLNPPMPLLKKLDIELRIRLSIKQAVEKTTKPGNLVEPFAPKAQKKRNVTFSFHFIHFST